MVNRSRRNSVRPTYAANGTCRQMLRELQTIDFSMVETILYLDAYPESREALEYYHKLHEERKRLLAAMQAAGCPPITAMDSHSRTEWNWIRGPWPWEPDAN